MNPKTLERLLLLEQSGELSPKQRRELEAQLAAAAGARRQREELRRFTAALPPAAARPAPGATTTIAARLRPPGQTPFTLLPAWKPALAAVAAIALLLGVRAYRIRPESTLPASAESAAVSDADWTDPLDTEFTELENLIAAISADDAFEITEL